MYTSTLISKHKQRSVNRPMRSRGQQAGCAREGCIAELLVPYMYVYTYIYIYMILLFYIYIHTHTYIYIYIYIHIHMQVGVHCEYFCIHAYIAGMHP